MSNVGTMVSGRWRTRVLGVSALLLIGALAVPSVASSDQGLPYPIGVPSSSEPSGYAPPSADALPGFSLSYSTDFTGSALPAGWGAFSDASSGDPGSQWEDSQVVVSGGLLQLNAAQDPALNNEWVTGGLCQCGESQTYGAYFVRSRETGPGPTIVELLWPTQGWPPEIDFNETSGTTTQSFGTNIWGLDSNGDKEQQQFLMSIDMTQWHTWGVIWTPTSIILTVDGQAWGTFTTPSEIPSQSMSLHIQQQTWCSSGYACPTSPQSTDVDWVAEYAPSESSSPPTTVVTSPPTTTTTSPTVSPPAPPVTTTPPTTTTTTVTHPPAADLIFLSSFADNSSALSPTLKTKIDRLAAKIHGSDDDSVTLTGYSTDVLGRAVALSIARARVHNVESYLRRRLSELGDSRVTILARAALTQGSTVTAKLKSQSVVALVQ